MSDETGERPATTARSVPLSTTAAPAAVAWDRDNMTDPAAPGPEAYAVRILVADLARLQAGAGLAEYYRQQIETLEGELEQARAEVVKLRTAAEKLAVEVADHDVNCGAPCVCACHAAAPTSTQPAQDVR